MRGVFLLLGIALSHYLLTFTTRPEHQWDPPKAFAPIDSTMIQVPHTSCGHLGDPEEVAYTFTQPSVGLEAPAGTPVVAQDT